MKKKPLHLSANKILNLHILDYLRYLILFVAALILVLTFFPAVIGESKYYLYKSDQYFTEISSKKESKENIQESRLPVPPNYNFSIVIPKINVSAPVFSNTDPFNEKEYTSVLRDGVAHAKGSSYPGEVGNSFIFAHSTNIFDNVSKYNAIFYLIGKLENNDEIYLYYKNQRFRYVVYDKKIVSADAISYLKPLIPNVKTLTLSTCYPPGTTWKRLIVISKIE